MAKALTLEQAAKVGVWFLVSAALLLFGPMLADRWIFDPAATPAVRWAAVALSVFSLIPWLAYAGWGLSIADEYNRRTLVIGTALAFALAILFSVATSVMADARLIEYPIGLNLPIAFVLWVIAVGLVAGYEKLRGIR